MGTGAAGATSEEANEPSRLFVGGRAQTGDQTTARAGWYPDPQLANDATWPPLDSARGVADLGGSRRLFVTNNIKHKTHTIKIKGWWPPRCGPSPRTFAGIAGVSCDPRVKGLGRDIEWPEPCRPVLTTETFKFVHGGGLKEAFCYQQHKTQNTHH